MARSFIPRTFSPPNLGPRVYGRYLEVAPSLAALGATARSAPRARIPRTSAAPGAAGRVAVQRGAPATAAVAPEERGAVAARATTGREGLPPWARTIGLPPSALATLPAVFQASQVYEPHNLPGGTRLDLTGARLTPAQLATIGSPGTGTGLGGFLDTIRAIGRQLDPTANRSIVGQIVKGQQAQAQPPVAVAPPVPAYQGVVQSFVPQDNTQKMLLIGAAGLAGVLLVMQLRK